MLQDEEKKWRMAKRRDDLILLLKGWAAGVGDNRMKSDAGP